MTHALYLLGAPGVGKSSVMRELLRPWTVGDYVRFTEREMFGHHLYDAPRDLKGAYLGHLRPEFPGTDALSMSVQPHAINWLKQTDGGFDCIYGEGARLGNAAFLLELARRSNLTVVLLTASPEVVESRLQSRPDSSSHKTGRSGRAQDQKWRDGQETRSRNTAQKMIEFLEEFPCMQVLTVDTDRAKDASSVAQAILKAANS